MAINKEAFASFFSGYYDTIMKGDFMNNKCALIICPYEEKERLLRENNHNFSLYPMKFMTKEDFLHHYFYDYSLDSYYYLMKTYGFQYDVAKVYLKNMIVIDENRTYHSKKLETLKNLKKELIEQGLFHYHKAFVNNLSRYDIQVKQYYDLDLFEEKAIGYVTEIPDATLMADVYSFSTMEEEISFVCIQIRELLKKGIDIDCIYLTNVSSDYYYTIEKLFSYYHIPINIPYQHSIYHTSIIQKYLKSKELNLEDTRGNKIYQKLFSVLEKLEGLEQDEIYDILLKEELKHTYLDIPKKKKAVSIVDFYEKHFSEDDYVFVVGFNQDVLPKTEKDISYISDSIKEEVDLYPTTYLNERAKKTTIYLLSKISHLFLSYKKSTPFASFYPSSLISELDLEVKSYDIYSYHYSDIYNKIQLVEMMDQYYLYGEKKNHLEELYYHYSIPYRTYHNQFSGIELDSYHKNLDYPLTLSYTSLNQYNECKFRYYIHSILKLDSYTPTFAAFIGSMYHEILSLYERDSFDFEKEYQNYLEKRELSLKETVLLIRIKKDLLELLEVLKKQKLLLGYDNAYYEKRVEIPIREDISVRFVGFIDKILFYQKIDDSYFSIIDYKSGYIDTHIEPMKYGLHMQLPIYLYFLYYSKVFQNPIFTGIYYQNILFSYPTWSTKLETEKKSQYLLKGYSTDHVDILSRFDTTYENSEVIKSMKYSEEKGFGTYSKVFDDDTVLQIVRYTKKHIDTKTQEILDGDFQINPKVYNGENVSCKFCTFRDLCFMRDSDLVYLDKVNDLSFLGGDE